MTKKQLIQEISETTGLKENQVQLIVAAFLSIVIENVAINERIALQGFGSFTRKKRAAKIAQNIAKKVPVLIPERFVPFFIPSGDFYNRAKIK